MFTTFENYRWSNYEETMEDNPRTYGLNKEKNKKNSGWKTVKSAGKGFNHETLIFLWNFHSLISVCRQPFSWSPHASSMILEFFLKVSLVVMKHLLGHKKDPSELLSSPVFTSFYFMVQRACTRGDPRPCPHANQKSRDLIAYHIAFTRKSKWALFNLVTGDQNGASSGVIFWWGTAESLWSMPKHSISAAKQSAWLLEWIFKIA